MFSCGGKSDTAVLANISFYHPHEIYVMYSALYKYKCQGNMYLSICTSIGAIVECPSPTPAAGVMHMGGYLAPHTGGQFLFIYQGGDTIYI